MEQKEYEIVIGDSKEELNAVVNIRLDEGWELYGSPSVAMSTYAVYEDIRETYLFAQALTKKKENEENNNS